MTPIATPKAIAVDLDGTLLRTDKTVSQANCQAIQRCREAGVLVLPATARPSRSANVLLKDTGLVPGPGVFLGGAIAFTHEGSRCVDKRIPQDVLAAVLEMILDCAPEAWITLETDESWCMNKELQIVAPAVPTYGEPKIMEVDQLVRESAAKIVASWDGRSLEEAYNRLKNTFGSSLSYIITAGGEWLEVLPENTGKETALEVLLGLNGISIEDCAAFGDGSNDISFLAGCGISIAMANAVPACLEVADYVTKTNDEDGFAWAVSELLGI